jgi:ADP-ribose pyrophosphatase YjhB (NUDIX family)
MQINIRTYDDLEELKERLEELGILNATILPAQIGSTWGWELYINGEKADMSQVQHIAIKSKFGTVNFGTEAVSGYNMFSYREVGLGGSVTIPFVFLNDNGKIVEHINQATDILVGVLWQNRPKQGGEVQNCPRGFLASEDETHQAAADRELHQETGFKGNTFELPGRPMNCNSALVETDQDGGVRFFAIQMSGKNLTMVDGKLEIPETQESIPEKTAEMIGKCQFISIWDAIQLGDGFTNVAAARLAGWIKTQKIT